MIGRVRQSRPRRFPGRLRAPDGDRGSFAALELAILAPFVVVMLLVVVGFGRVSRGRQLVDHAAEAASRAASLSVSPGEADTAARQAAELTLSNGGLSCESMSVAVDTSQFYAGGRVIANLTCRADLSGLALAGLPGSVTLTAEATSPLETYRTFSLGFSNSEASAVSNRRVEDAR